MTDEKVTVVEFSGYPTLSLRFVKRDDTRVLQQKHQVTRRYSNGVVEDGTEWRDVPYYEAVHDE